MLLETSDAQLLRAAALSTKRDLRTSIQCSRVRRRRRARDQPPTHFQWTKGRMDRYPRSIHLSYTVNCFVNSKTSLPAQPRMACMHATHNGSLVPSPLAISFPSKHPSYTPRSPSHRFAARANKCAGPRSLALTVRSCRTRARPVRCLSLCARPWGHFQLVESCMALADTAILRRKIPPSQLAPRADLGRAPKRPLSISSRATVPCPASKSLGLILPRRAGRCP